MSLDPSSLVSIEWLARLELRLLSSLGRENSSVAFTKALGAIIGDLLRTYCNEAEGVCYHGLGAASFAGKRIGYRPFLAVTDSLVDCGLLERRMGLVKYDASSDGSATRFRATSALIADADLHGVRAVDWQRHFAPAPRRLSNAYPIHLRDKSWRKGKTRISGKKLAIDKTDPLVMEFAAQVNRINAALMAVDITGVEHDAFRMVLTRTKTDHGYKQGGRLYSNFQNQKREDRHLIRINEEQTVELDIKSSHATIIHGLLNVPRPNRADLFNIEGFDRKLVKSLVNASLGYGKFHKKWPKHIAQQYAADHGGRNLETVYPLANVQNAILSAIPAMNAWQTSGLTWADLQFVESRAITDALEELLVVHKIAALSIHDSLIIPCSKEAIAREVLTRCFRRHVGIDPILETKSHS